MLIRPAIPNDAAELVRLLHQVEDVHYAIRPDLFIKGGVKHTQNEIAQLLADPEQCIFVAVASESASTPAPTSAPAPISIPASTSTPAPEKIISTKYNNNDQISSNNTSKQVHSTFPCETEVTTQTKITAETDSQAQQVMPSALSETSCDSGPVLLGYMMCKWLHEDGKHAMHEGTTLFIDDICVDEQARGKGVATALYKYLLTVAKEAGATRMALNVWKGNESAKALYEHWGFSSYSTMMDQML